MSNDVLNWAKKVTVGGQTRKAVFLLLADHADDKGRAWPAQETIAETLEMSVRTVRSAITELCEAGLLTRKKRWRPDGTRATDILKFDMDLVNRQELPVRPEQPANERQITGKSRQTHRQMAPEQPAGAAGNPSQGEPSEGNHHKQNGSEATASGRPAGAALPANASWTDRLWLDGKVWLMECGCTPKLAGDVIGQWLRRFHDPERIHGAIAAAKSARTQSPIPYVLAVLDVPQTRSRASPRQRSSATTRLIERMEARHARQANRDQEDAVGSRGSGPFIEHEGDGRPAGPLH